MRGRTMLKFGIAVAATLLIAVIVYGSLQAEDEFNGDDGGAVATSTPVAILQAMAALQATPTLAPGTITLQELLGTTTSPIILAARGVDIESILAANTGPPPRVGGFTIRVRGGDNPCRYMNQGSSVTTFAGGQMVLEFIAGTWEANLADTGEMHLYGATGPHLFEIEDKGGDVILSVPVDRGATVLGVVLFPEVGLYGLYDRLRPDLGQIGEYFAGPMWQPGGGNMQPWGDWCRANDLFKPPIEESVP